MPIFAYKALSENGTVHHGEKAASSAEVLREELVAQGLLVQNVREKRSGLGFTRRARIKPVDFMLFNQELLALVRAGLTITEALMLAAERPDSPSLSHMLNRVQEDVRRGMDFSDACAQHPDAFDGMYIAALKAGEKTGGLAATLQKYQVYLRQRISMQKKISQSLAYPLFLLITLGVILAVLFTFVLPRFVSLYADFGAQLPLPTRILMTLVDNLPYYALATAVLGTVVWLAWRRWLRLGVNQARMDHFKERIPLLGNIYRYSGVAQIARSLSSLLSGGTSLVEAMRITQASTAHRAQAARLSTAIAQVTEGKSLAQAMQSTGLLPRSAIKMVEVGEATGGLDAMLGEVATFYEESLEHTLSRIMILIEPILMLLMGVLVGGTIIVMYLPIFYIVDVIK